MAPVPEMTFSARGEQPQYNAEEVALANSIRSRFTLEGKHAIVTGAARGLGYAVATGFLQHGIARLALLDTDAGQLEIARTELLKTATTAQILTFVIDVTSADSLAEVIKQIGDEFGAIHVCATFAGIVESVRATDYTAEDFRQILDVNTTGTFLTAQAVGRHMIKLGTGGSIILVASMAGHIVNYPQTHVAYGTSKAAVHHMTRCLAAEWASHGIRVNSLSPGYMETRLNNGEHLTNVLPTWYERTPMGRFGRPEEIIGPVVFMASPASSFMTGNDMIVDGGYTLF